MKNWQGDLLDIVDNAQSEHAVFKKIEEAALSLGFEYCAYGLRIPYSISNPKTIILNNYPKAWQDHYISEDYLQIDPTVLHGRRTQTPLIWSNDVFASARQFWDEAQSFGLCIGWAQSSLDAVGVGGMLTLARTNGELTSSELVSQEIKMRWLVNISHLALSRILNSGRAAMPALTIREIEVLKWTADGKTSGEISTLLAVSENTVNFHVKNAVAKLQTANKTAAVVRAAMFGLLN